MRKESMRRAPERTYQVVSCDYGEPFDLDSYVHGYYESQAEAEEEATRYSSNSTYTIVFDQNGIPVFTTFVTQLEIAATR